VPGSRLLVLVTCRAAAGDPWRAALGDLARLPGFHVVRLAPLSQTAVAEILHQAGLTVDLGLARVVHARSEGNPLYVATLARVLATQPVIAPDADTVAQIAGGSAEVGRLVWSLLRDLDDSARGLLAAASVLGTDFAAALAAEVCQTSQDVTRALSAAEGSGLVTRRPDRPDSGSRTP
jgi:predicted ATPase